jgi:hypothetical protein
MVGSKYLASERPRTWAHLYLGGALVMKKNKAFNPIALGTTTPGDFSVMQVSEKSGCATMFKDNENRWL